MVTVEEMARFEVSAALDPADCAQLCRVAGDISLSPGEFAVHEGDEPALFGLLEGWIEAVKLVDGVECVVGVRVPGDLLGEVSVTLGMGHPAGFRAAEASRIFPGRAQRLPRCRPPWSSSWDASCAELRRFLNRTQVRFRWLQPDVPADS